MTFEEAREVVHGLPGRMVEVDVGFPDSRGELVHALAGFSGRVRDVMRGGARGLPERWFIWFESDGELKPGTAYVVLDRAGFEGGEVIGSGVSVEELDDADPAMGSTWTIRLRNFGVVTEIDVYVGT